MYEISYDDGDKQVSVPAVFIQDLGTAQREKKLAKTRAQQENSRVPGIFNVGDKVVANYRSSGKWYAGVVAEVTHVENTAIYQISYLDGEAENDVTSERVRALSWRSGDFVEAKYRGKVYYPGRITAVVGETVNISYDDGEREARVEWRHIRSLELQQLTFEVGDSVEANYRSSGRFFNGKIADADKELRLYDIIFDDGEEEYGVPQHHVRRTSVIQAPVQVEGPRMTTNEVIFGDQYEFKGGDKIEAKYRGGSRFFPGQIARLIRDEESTGHANNKYDVFYDDGDKEFAISGKLVRGNRFVHNVDLASHRRLFHCSIHSHSIFPYI